MDRVGPTIVGRRSTLSADVARDLLTRNEVPHRWVDLDRDPLATVRTIVFIDKHQLNRYM
jgi:hypothetical protein